MKKGWIAFIQRKKTVSKGRIKLPALYKRVQQNSNNTYTYYNYLFKCRCHLHLLYIHIQPDMILYDRVVLMTNWIYLSSDD